MAEPDRYGVLGPSQGAMTSVCFMWRKPGAFRDFALNSPIGEVVGRVIGAETIRLYHDHLFAKPPRSPKIMQWHCDETAWPVRGEMAPNIWTAFSPVNAQNGRIEYVAGFHRHCVERGLHFGFRPDQANGLCPDFEKEAHDLQGVRPCKPILAAQPKTQEVA
jgi:ectoine hydroxylase-related dioxygenase (phytanoyl-CoA dioxygenase family)